MDREDTIVLLGCARNGKSTLANRIIGDTAFLQFQTKPGFIHCTAKPEEGRGYWFGTESLGRVKVIDTPGFDAEKATTDDEHRENIIKQLSKQEVNVFTIVVGFGQMNFPRFLLNLLYDMEKMCNSPKFWNYVTLVLSNVDFQSPRQVGELGQKKDHFREYLRAHLPQAAEIPIFCVDSRDWASDINKLEFSKFRDLVQGKTPTFVCDNMLTLVKTKKTYSRRIPENPLTRDGYVHSGQLRHSVFDIRIPPGYDLFSYELIETTGNGEHGQKKGDYTENGHPIVWAEIWCGGKFGFLGTGGNSWHGARLVAHYGKTEHKEVEESHWEKV